MEILAPAGSREALERAVAAGADAVYLGYASFNARAGAGNFDREALADAIRYCHLHHVRVHVTLNTLVKDRELPEVRKVLVLLNELRADAVLIQDLGVLTMARNCFPDLPVHASTQMAIHNAAGVRFCKDMGMTRAVMARECSLEELRLAAREGIEIEAFGHGAQCVSVSGECLMSSMIGDRSGNRGRCAQPCRMQYTFDGKTAAWLSPRDVCLRDHMQEMEKAGVASLKIEGRLKRPEYAWVVANAYHQGEEQLRSGTFAPAAREEKQALLQIFHRGGFMEGYAMGCEDAGVIAADRVNHGGLPLGVVEAVAGGMARIRLETELHNGDGLQFRGNEGDREMTYSGPDGAAGTVAVLRLRPGLRVEKGDKVIRLADQRQLEEAMKAPCPPIPVDMVLTAMQGQPAQLTLTDGTSWVTLEGDTVQPAQKRAMTEADARRSLEKTGDTPFRLRELTVYTDNAFMAASVLNALRREGLEKLAEERIAAFTRPEGRILEETPAEHLSQPAVSAAVFRSGEQYEALKDTDLLPIWFPEDWRLSSLEQALNKLQSPVWLQLPTVCRQATLEQLHDFVKEHREKIAGVVLGSVGQLGLSWPVPMAAGQGIPVMNRRTAQFLLGRGCRFMVASPELTKAETEELITGLPGILVPAYGRTQLMLLHHCPARTALGLSRGHEACNLCDRMDARSLKDKDLTDRMGCRYPLQRQRLPEGCRIRLLNTLPTWINTTAPTLAEFTVETAQEVQQILAGQKPEKTTSGHWKREVE